MKQWRNFSKPVHFSLCKYFIRNASDNPGVRVRFAPSPTGLLHVGGLRTALYNYLFCKSQNGSFILRIEDTDQSRLVEGAVEKLEDDLNWAGLVPDEGPSVGGNCGPYFQSQRLNIYKQEVERLLEDGKAYYCFCSERRLDLLRRDSLRRREIPKYDNHCRHLSKLTVQSNLENGVEHCVRFKLSPFTEAHHDLIFGEIIHNVAEFEGDPVIQKSDGFPTYHLANVVDDHYMKISHVLRGVEWQPSTTKHLLLYKAFQWDPPKYAHLPVLLNEDGSKLSKRNNDITVDSFRRNAIYPRALINFLTLCGGGFIKPDNTEKITHLKNLDEFISKFSLDLLNVNNCQIPLQRLKEFNRIEIKERIDNEESFKELIKHTRTLIETEFKERNISPTFISDRRLIRVLQCNRTRISTLKDLTTPDFHFLWLEPLQESLSECNDLFFETLPEVIEIVKKCENFDSFNFSGSFDEIIANHGIKYAEFMKSLRVCLTGLRKGPSISEIFAQLGQEITLQRLELTQCRRKQITENKQLVS